MSLKISTETTFLLDMVNFSYGPELLTNGDFGTGDLTGWSGSTPPFSVASNQLVCTTESSSDLLVQAGVITIGVTYSVSVNVTTLATGNFTIQCGSASQSVTATGSQTFEMLCAASTHFLLRDTGYSFTADDFSVKAIL